MQLAARPLPKATPKLKAKGRGRGRGKGKSKGNGKGKGKKVAPSAEVPVAAPDAALATEVSEVAAEHHLPEEGPSKKLIEMFSAMQAAAIALSSERNCLGMDIIHFLVAPIRSDYTRMQESLRGGHRNVCKFFTELSRGAMHTASVEIWQCLRTPEVLRACGLTLECTLQAEEEVLPGDAVTLEQDQIANLLDQCALALIAERVDESCTHEHDFIAQCAGLLCPASQRETLLNLRSTVESFHRAQLETGSSTLQSIIFRSSLNGSIEKALRAKSATTLSYECA